ncbi:outer membrane protein OmpA-like peptidoglycan-associated protein [Flavobacterium sp. PL11]|uniref:OmpA family protein n=1 Tax=Flavobacterium sp. PL11 TaxID=3071717 RepID=UPI002E06A9E3|nr:outer membrane protein OmpA-like peptidoglycan-associated protein [Flavobacterium sp. PL11]
MRGLSILIMIFILTINKSYCQTERAIKEADKKFANFAFVDAREVYLEVVKSGYKSENIYKKLGDSYYFNNDLLNALPWFENLYNFQKKIEPEYLFRYAMALKSNKRYEAAEKILQEYYLATDPNFNNDKRNDLKNINDIIALNKNKFSIEKIAINSVNSDYSPSYYGSSLVFSSNRKDKSKSSQKIHKWNNEPFSDLYMVLIKKDNILDSKVERFSEEINSLYHESSATFTNDANTIYFTRNNFNNNKYKVNSNGVNLLKIFVSTKNKEGKWRIPVELPFNSNEYSCAHPALSPDEKKLYFSSDMPGTIGMSDIFVVDINGDGSYGIPRNLGNKINTAARESYPFISKKNQLFFSSDGHNGLGGFDLFVTELKNDEVVNEIINLGSPINSTTDDISLILDTDDNTGFFSSNRKDAFGSDDIYSFKLSSALVSSCKQYLSGVVVDKNSKNRLNNVTVQLFEDNLQLVKTITTNEKGEYAFDLDCNKQYNIRFSYQDFQTSEKTINADSQFEKKIKYDVALQKGKLLGRESITYGDDLSKYLELDPIYFDFDKTNIRPDAAVELQKVISFLKINKTIKVDIRSHTDSQGERAYNLKLSGQRALSTLNYFIKNGIERSRLKARGYGDTQLVNDCVYGTVCSEEDHQLNRRSEFIVVSDNEDASFENASIINNVSENRNKATNSVMKNDNVISLSNSLISSNEYYDFTGSNLIYSVQVGALIKPDNASFNNIKVPIFNYKYQDGFTRFFSGTFINVKDAQDYKTTLTKKGITNLFVVKLKGNQILPL